MHLMLDLDGQIPSFCVITPGKEHEIRQARRRHYEPDSILVFDRGYTDDHWLHQLQLQGVYFVTRLKKVLVVQHINTATFHCLRGIHIV